MSTRIYGASDDLIEFDGDVSGEVGCYSSREDKDRPALVICSDGTILTAIYGDADNGGIWKFTVKHQGSLFDRMVICEDEDAEPHSDEALFHVGLKWAYVAKDWERAR
jgi:hypothetical protein